MYIYNRHACNSDYEKSLKEYFLFFIKGFILCSWQSFRHDLLQHFPLQTIILLCQTNTLEYLQNRGFPGHRDCWCCEELMISLRKNNQGCRFDVVCNAEGSAGEPSCAGMGTSVQCLLLRRDAPGMQKCWSAGRRVARVGSAKCDGPRTVAGFLLCFISFIFPSDQPVSPFSWLTLN